MFRSTARRRLPWSSLLVVSLVVVSAGGCGSDLPETAPVTGTVTIDGDLVTEGKIAFYPAQGRPAMGQISKDGTYRLTTFAEGDGAVLGEHTVTIKSSRVTGTPAPQTFADEITQAKRKDTRIEAGIIEWVVPEEYSRRETTSLTRTVESGSNTIDFDLSRDDAAEPTADE